MKRIFPYLVIAFAVGLLFWLAASTQRKKHVFDQRLSFNRRDKIPYGLYLAYQNLSKVFPAASISVNRKAPAFWDSLDMNGKGQALMVIVPSFMASGNEMKQLVEFAKNGNNVFISTAFVSYEAQAFLHCDVPDVFDINEDLDLNKNIDSFSVSLNDPPFSGNQEYGCPGTRYESYFSKFDSEISTSLGKGIYIMPNLVDFKAGKGNIYLHLTPLAFSNYFLLFGHNMDYYGKLLSLLPADTRRLAWDEYFLYKRNSENNGADGSSLSALMSQRSFRAALWLLIALLALFVLQEMRRKQRIIPVVAKPRNDSLEFVKTIGRLYYEKRDNRNLARKMAAYFLEHVRNRYKLSTTYLNEEFIILLQRKTAQPDENIRKIVSFMNEIEMSEDFTNEQLAGFHRTLEAFYQNA